MKCLLGKVLFDRNESEEDLLLSLHQLQHHMSILDYHLEQIENHIGVTPYLGCSLGSNKKHITIDTTNLDPSS